MSTTPIPIPQQSPQTIDPAMASAYLREQIASQANTTGLTQIGPNLGSAKPPVQKQFQQPGEQQNQAFGPGQGGAAKKQSMQNLVKSVQGIAQQFGQYQQAKQNRQYEQTITRFTGAVQGIQQAQAALKTNPQDDTAKAALQQNQTILNDMVNDQKQHKIITKAFGVDDKNANTPERQAAIAALKKQMGVGDKAAGVMSQIPQQQQLSPQGQAQQMARQAGVVGAPATGSALLNNITRMASDQVKAGTAVDKLIPQLAKAGLTVPQTEEGYAKNEDGTLQIVPMTADQRALNPALKAQDEYKASQIALNQAKTALATDPKNIQNVARMMNAQSNDMKARAAMIHAMKYQPGSATSASDMKDLVDMFHEGKVDPSQLPGFGKARTEFLEELHKRYPDDNAAQASEDYKFASNQQTQMILKGLDNLTGPDGKSGNLSEVVKMSNGIKRTDLPPINDIEAWGKINTGDPKMAAYYAGVLEVSDQVAKILQGGGTGSGTSDTKLKQAQSILNARFSPSQIKDIAGTLSTLLSNRKQSIIGNNRYLKNQYQSQGTGEPENPEDPAGLFN